MAAPPPGWTTGGYSAVTSIISGTSPDFSSFRPALSIEYYLPSSGATRPTSQGNLTSPFISRSVPRVLHVDAGPVGSDIDGTGWIDRPLATLVFALQHAGPGDTVLLRAGNHVGGVSISRPRVTLAGFPGERAVVSAPLVPDSPIVIQVRPDARFTTLLNLEIRGGYYCELMAAGCWELMRCHAMPSISFDLRYLMQMEFWWIRSGTGDARAATAEASELLPRPILM